jgi:hypothetical protein
MFLSRVFERYVTGRDSRNRGPKLKSPTDSRAIKDGHDTFVVCATGAAIKAAMCLDAVADDLAAAMFAFGRQRVNRAFKTIKVMRFAILYDFQWFVVIVFAHFALHKLYLSQERDVPTSRWTAAFTF